MRVIDIENIIFNMRSQTQFVLRCEEVFHDKISSAAAAIVNHRRQRPYVALTGPSGSGKTTSAMRLKSYLNNLGVPVILVSMDNFFLDMDKRPPVAQTDWESPLCVDVEELTACLDALEYIKVNNRPTTPVAPQPVQAEPVKEPEQNDETKVVADEISQNLAAMIGETEDAAPTAEPKHPTQEATTKFTGLKFGPNYDPTK